MLLLLRFFKLEFVSLIKSQKSAYSCILDDDAFVFVNAPYSQLLIQILLFDTINDSEIPYRVNVQFPLIFFFISGCKNYFKNTPI